LIQITAIPAAPAALLSVMALIAFATLLRMHDGSREPLR
jgi:hypothetical protein